MAYLQFSWHESFLLRQREGGFLHFEQENFGVIIRLRLEKLCTVYKKHVFSDLITTLDEHSN